MHIKSACKNVFEKLLKKQFDRTDIFQTYAPQQPIYVLKTSFQVSRFDQIKWCSCQSWIC